MSIVTECSNLLCKKVTIRRRSFVSKVVQSQMHVSDGFNNAYVHVKSIIVMQLVYNYLYFFVCTEQCFETAVSNHGEST